MLKKLIISLPALIFVFCGCFQKYPGVNKRPEISVTGESIVYVTPDKITLRFGIETQDMDINKAKEKNNQVLKNTLAIIRGQEVPDSDIQTDRLTIQSQYSGYENRQFLGYFVNNNIVLTLTEADKAEVIITRVLQSGVNRIFGMDFQTTQLQKYRAQARELALKAAREKAEKMASVFGQSIGTALKIQEDDNRRDFVNERMKSQNVSFSHGQAGGDIPETIALGKIPVRANVFVVFELK